MKERPILFSAPMVRAILADRKRATRRIIAPQPENPEIRGDISPVWGQGIPRSNLDAYCVHAAFNHNGKREDRWLPCPYGKPGDLLWVRENWIYQGSEAHFGGGREPSAAAWIKYPADRITRKIPRPIHDNSGIPSQRAQREGESDWDYQEFLSGWFSACRPSIHMPRWASRLSLEITDIHVERLQEITQVEAMEEGVLTLGEEWIAAQFPEYVAACKATPDGERPPLGPSPRMRFKALWNSINGCDSWDRNPYVWVVRFNRQIELV